jgi:serine/threonine-protein kinase PpkA
MKTTHVHRSRLVLLRCLLGLMLVGTVCADDGFEALKSEIESRAHAIHQAKSSGALQEGPDGLLMAGGTPTPESADLLRQENQARQQMFGLIAARTKDTPAQVAAKFAAQARQEQVMLPPGPAPSPLGPVPSPPAPAPASTPQPATPSNADAPFVPVSPGSRVPLRLLTRPLAVLRESAAENAPAKAGALPAFTALIARRHEPGWYLVADKVDGPARGWMNEKDVIEWKHNLVANFTHPDGRNRAVIVRDKSTLKDLLAHGPAQGAAFVSKYLGTSPPEDFLGAEPEGWARLQNQFFLLPITDHEVVPSDTAQDTYILRVAAATHERGARPRIEQARAPTATGAAPKLDLVFVMDLTRSMGPFVEKTRQMLADIASSLAGNGIAPETVAFGLWGYRDDPNLCPGIEFNTRNFTPELQALPEFTHTLGTVEETRADSVDYAEDVYAGVADAISRTRWRSDAVKLILLVGDAPGRGIREEEEECKHRPRPIGTASGMNVEELRELASAQAVNISTIYLESPKWRQFTERGERQFRQLGRNPGSGSSLGSFALLNAEDPSDYAKCARDFAGKLGDNLRALGSRNELPVAAPVPSGKADPGAAGRQMADNVFRSAMIEWASARKNLPMPSDIDGWVLDKDPADPSKTALEASVLLSRNQLDSLRRLTDDVVNASLRSQLSNEDLFTSLLAVSATGTRDPERLRHAHDLQQAGMIPDFLQGLPYKSLVMYHSQESWRAMSADEQNQFVTTVESKLRYYQDIYAESAMWTKINPNDDDANKVYAVPLKNLP